MNQTSHENTETLALKATVASLQNIVNQKEETIGRYQILLKECREEHNAAVASLQEEISNLQQVSFEKQSQLTHREKEATETAKEKPDHVRSIMEKYLVKVHELEDELAQAHDEISQLARQLIDCKKNVDRLKSLPSAREKQNTPSQWSRKKEEQQEEKEKDSEEEKVDSDKDDGDNSSGGDGSNVGDGNEDDENVEMKELETAYAGLAMQLKEKTQQIEKQNQTISELKKNKAVISNRDRLRAELERKKRRLEMLESWHEEDKTEINRLRHQLTNRPSRSEGVASIREEQLQR
ncbi:uncharacterized protein LOC142324615 isoform X2 [Lycorma delicatula]|uniref:uncharacterized protein LOC142324615 isoform X2 n=1 Tax=Lycorma delicatula TaxID=130591 RepID=UPI003F513278